MPAIGPLSNARHERFALLVAQGRALSDAYLACGYAGNKRSIDSNASRLMMVDKIRRRVAALQRQAVEQANVTIEGLVSEAGAIQRAAMMEGNHNAAVAALTAKAKLAGLWIERSTSENLNVSYSISDQLPSEDDWQRERTQVIDAKSVSVKRADD
jgi:hypothetical protein